MFRSLRSRVALTAVLSVAATSLVVMFSIAMALGPVSQHNQQVQARIILDRALALEDKVSPSRLADRLSEPGFSVVVTRDGEEYPSSDSTVAVKTVQTSAAYYTISETLPKTGETVTVATLNLNTFDIYGQILSIGVPTIAVALVVLVLALRLVTGIALRPLNDMTKLATEIAEGELGRRLEVEDADTELGRTAVAFDKMLDALETSLHRARLAEERLRQLCADVAHELRSPVSSMVAAADNLMRELSLGKRTAAANRALAEDTAMAVVRDGRRAGRIVGDLTLAAQLDVQELAGREVIKQRVDLSQLLQQSVDAFAIGSDYQVNLRDEAGTTWTQADPERVQQIITNLLSNAGRWTETKVDVVARLASTDGRVSGNGGTRVGTQWVLTVTDDGPGVPDDQRENIFGRFVRLDSHRARSKGGSGLGLSISRALAQAHDGSLVCLPASENAHGATFQLSLPVSK